MLAEGFPPAAVTFGVVSAPASIVTAAQRDNDASKRVPAFMEHNLLGRRELVLVTRCETRERPVWTRRGQSGYRSSAVRCPCALLLLTTALAPVGGHWPFARRRKGRRKAPIRSREMFAVSPTLGRRRGDLEVKKGCSSGFAPLRSVSNERRFEAADRRSRC